MKRRHKKRWPGYTPDLSLKRHGTNVCTMRDLEDKKKNWICMVCGYATRQFASTWISESTEKSLSSTKCPRHGETLVDCGMAENVPRTAKKRIQMAMTFVLQDAKKLIERMKFRSRFSSQSLEK